MYPQQFNTKSSKAVGGDLGTKLPTFCTQIDRDTDRQADSSIPSHRYQ